MSVWSLISKIRYFFSSRRVKSDVLKKGLILVGESDPAERRRIQALLTKANYDVEFESDTLQLIGKTSKLNPDLIMIDSDLKGGYGYLPAIHYFRNNLNKPVILMLHPRSVHRYKGFNITQLDGIIVKPVVKASMLSNIESAITEHYYKEIKKHRQTNAPTPLGSKPEPINYNSTRGAISFPHPSAPTVAY